MNKMNRFLALFLALAISLAFSFNKPTNDLGLWNINSEANQAQQKSKAVDKKVLLGNWTRTDAEYQIKISDVLQDGKLKAGYFNPKSINVGKATWTNTKAVLKIYIELRDVN